MKSLINGQDRACPADHQGRECLQAASHTRGHVCGIDRSPDLVHDLARGAQGKGLGPQRLMNS